MDKNMDFNFPEGFVANGWHIGIKDNAKEFDFGFLHSTVPSTSAVVFTKNNFTGWPVVVGRKYNHLGKFRTVIANSGNSNTATGPKGLELITEYSKVAAKSLDISIEEILPASTGVIGYSLDDKRKIIMEACHDIPEKIKASNFQNFAKAICTTDAYIKMKSKLLANGICISGIAKGAGMIEPNMATLLAFLCTDAKIDSHSLKLILDIAVNRSFNRITVDSDTSTSDTVAIIANGASGLDISFTPEMAQQVKNLTYPIKQEDLQAIEGLDEKGSLFIGTLIEICVELAQLIVRDGEGSTKLVELSIKGAKTQEQALKIARSVLNSPLFKTAIYGADPNWGRILMAIGKVFDEKIDEKKLKIYLGDLCLFPSYKINLDLIIKYLKNESIKLIIDLGSGEINETIWGCDLNENYVHLNSSYTT